MQDEGLRVWYASEETMGGRILHEQVERALQMHDRLLLVLSEHSMRSEWVMTEICHARQRQVREGQRVLFPIGLLPLDEIRQWQCLDADTGEDLAREVRTHPIADFSNWKDHDAFEAGFKRLMDDLKKEPEREDPDQEGGAS